MNLRPARRDRVETRAVLRGLAFGAPVGLLVWALVLLALVRCCR